MPENRGLSSLCRTTVLRAWIACGVSIHQRYDRGAVVPASGRAESWQRASRRVSLDGGQGHARPQVENGSQDRVAGRRGHYSAQPIDTRLPRTGGLFESEVSAPRALSQSRRRRLNAKLERLDAPSRTTATSCYAKAASKGTPICQIDANCTAAPTAIPGSLAGSLRTATRSSFINPTRPPEGACHTSKSAPS